MASFPSDQAPQPEQEEKSISCNAALIGAKNARDQFLSETFQPNASEADSKVGPEDEQSSSSGISPKTSRRDPPSSSNDLVPSNGKENSSPIAHIRPFLNKEPCKNNGDSSDHKYEKNTHSKGEDKNGESPPYQIQGYDSFPDDGSDHSRIKDYADADDEDYGADGVEELETRDRRELTTSLSLSTLEEEIGLNESALESLSSKMEKLEQEMDMEWVKIQSYKENIGTLESRQAQLRKARDENATLVRGMEATLRKLLNRLRKKLEEKSDAIPQKDNTRPTGNEDTSQFWQCTIAEYKTHTGILHDRSEVKAIPNSSSGRQLKEGITISETQRLSIAPMYPDNDKGTVINTSTAGTSYTRTFNHISNGSAKVLDAQNDTRKMPSVPCHAGCPSGEPTFPESLKIEGQITPKEPFFDANEVTKRQITGIPPMNTNANLENMWLCSVESPPGYSYLRIYTPPLLLSISSEKILRQIIEIATSEVHLASKTWRSDDGTIDRTVWGSCLDICANVGYSSLPFSSNNSSNSIPSQSISSFPKSSKEDKKKPTIDPNIAICPYQLAGTCADIHCPYQHFPSDSGSTGVLDSKEKGDVSLAKDTVVAHENIGLVHLSSNKTRAPQLPELKINLPPIISNKDAEFGIQNVDGGAKGSASKREAKKNSMKQRQQENYTSTASKHTEITSVASRSQSKNVLKIKSAGQIDCNIDSTNYKKRKRDHLEAGTDPISSSPCKAKKNKSTKSNNPSSLKKCNGIKENDTSAPVSSNQGCLTINIESGKTDRLETIEVSVAQDQINESPTNVSSKTDFDKPKANVDKDNKEWLCEADYIALPSPLSKSDTDDTEYIHSSDSDQSVVMQRGKDGDVITKPIDRAISEKTPFWWWDERDSLHDLMDCGSKENASLTSWLSLAGFIVHKHGAGSKNDEQLDKKYTKWNVVSIEFLEHVLPPRPTEADSCTSPISLFDQRLVRVTARVLDCVRLCMHAGCYDICNTITSIGMQYISTEVSSASITVGVGDLLYNLMGHVHKIVAITNCSKNAVGIFKCQLALALLAEWVFAFDCDYFGLFQHDSKVAAHKGNLNEGDPSTSLGRKTIVFWSALLHDCLRSLEENSKVKKNLAPLYSLINDQEYLSRNTPREQFVGQWSKLLRSSIRTCLSQATSDVLSCSGSQLQHLLDCVSMGQLLSDNLLSSLQKDNILSPYTMLQLVLEPVWIEVIHHVRSLSHSDPSIRYLELITLVIMTPVISSSLSYAISSFTEEQSMTTLIEGRSKTLHRLNSRAYATLTAVDAFLYRLLKMVHQLGANTERKTMSDLLLAPLYALSVSLSVLLGLYNVAQIRLERALSEWSLPARTEDVEADPENRHFSQLLDGGMMLAYSELLWSQLVQLRISFSAEDDREKNHDLSKMIFYYGVHLNHLSLRGDAQLVRIAKHKDSASIKHKDLFELPELEQVPLKKVSQIPDQAKEACLMVTSLISLSDEQLDCVFKSTRKDDYDMPTIRQCLSQEKSIQTGGQANVCSLVLNDVPMDLKIRDAPEILHSMFPWSILLLGNALTSLSLMRCHLHSIPETFGVWLSNLKVLNVSHNNLSGLPASICLLKSLKELNVSSNKLVELPDRIGDMNYLCHLSARCNELEFLPNSLLKCTSLKYLDLSHNQIQSITSELPLKLFNLETLFLEDNPITRKSDHDP